MQVTKLKLAPPRAGSYCVQSDSRLQRRATLSSVTTPKALVLFNVGVMVTLALMYGVSRELVVGKTETLFDLLTFILAWIAIIGVPIVAIWGLKTYKRDRFWPALVVHPLALGLWLAVTFGATRAG